MMNTLKAVTVLGLAIASVVAMPTVIKSAASTFATREAYVQHLNAVPGRTWTAGLNSRFKDRPIGYSRALCGAHIQSIAEQEALVSSGELGAGVPAKWQALPDPPAEFDSEANWPHCAATISDIR